MLIPDKVNLLYIEDDESNVSLVTTILGQSKHTKFNIVHKYTLKDGLEYLEIKCFDSDELEIDVILLDLSLPNSHGVNTYKQVIDVCNFIPIVIISGHEEMACECVKLGAQDYLVKPNLGGGVVVRALKYAIERNKLERAKLKSERKYNHLIDVAGAAIFEIDFVNEKFIYVNDVMCKLVGWSRSELLKMSPTDVLTKSGVRVFYERQKALKNGEFIDNVTEYEARTKEGSIIWGLVTTEFVQDEEGNVVSGTAVSIDITDKKMAELEAKNKEEMIFNELENRIQQWRKEISVKSTAEAKQLKVIDNKILMFTNTGVA